MSATKRFMEIQEELAEELGFQSFPPALTFDYASSYVICMERDAYKLVWERIGMEGLAERVKEVESQVREPIANIVAAIIKHTGVLPCQHQLARDLQKHSPEELASLAKLDGTELAKHVKMTRDERCCF